jgi:hypothetical protein
MVGATRPGSDVSFDTSSESDFTSAMYRILADALVVFHLAYVAFVVLGLVAIVVGAALRWRWVRNFWFRSIHLLLIAIVVVETVCNCTCPITTWEYGLRAAAGEDVQTGTFVGRLAHRLLFATEGEAQIPAAAYYGFGAAVLATLVFVPPRWPQGMRRRLEKRPAGREKP